jgi:phage tail sheath protein FI
MPATLTYPGIYVEEVPSGVHPIAGVSTADTAFVDFFARGPIDEATRITSFADFERVFGGLDDLSEASYAIQQYYLNGGQIAWVVRVPSGDPGTATLDMGAALGSAPAQAITLSAANPGEWGNNLEAAAVGVRLSDASIATDRFNLVVREVRPAPGGKVEVLATEVFRNLNMTVGDKNYAKTVVNDQSQLALVTDVGLGALPETATPNDTGDGPADQSAFQPFTGGTAGSRPTANDLVGDPDEKTGMYALDRIAPFVFNLLCLPAATNLTTDRDPTPMQSVLSAAEAYCDLKRAFFIMDIPTLVATSAQMGQYLKDLEGLSLRSDHAAIYFPRLQMPDALQSNRLRNVGASGTMAGVYARTDSNRGVWKAPAGTDAALRNAQLAVRLDDLENGGLNPLGVNVLRNFPVVGNIGWGARTLDGADQQASEWKYIPVRRTALFIEESLYEGLKWVVFEPNDEPLWAQIRMNVGAFMNNLFRQGAFQGNTPAKAYFVKCDSETTTQNDIDLGVVNILVGFAPLKPAEFVVIRIQQLAGQIET